MGTLAGKCSTVTGCFVDRRDGEQPPVQVDDVGLRDVDDHLPERLIPKLSAPVERPGKVVARPEGNDSDGRTTVGERHPVHDRQDPSDRAVAAASWNRNVI